MKVFPDAGEVGRRWFEEVWNARRDETIDELMAPDSIGHVEGAEYRGPAAFREMRAAFLGALPDVRLEVEDVLTSPDGKRAAVRWHAYGTHGGEGFGFKATNRSIDVRGTTWLVVENGQIIEGWDTWNQSGLLASLQ